MAKVNDAEISDIGLQRVEPHSGTSTSALCANVFIIQLGSRASLYLHYCTNCEELRMDI